MWIWVVIDVVGQCVKGHKEVSYKGNFDTWKLGTRWHLKRSELLYDLAEWQAFPSLCISEVRIFQSFISIPHTFYISIVVYIVMCMITIRRHCSTPLEMFGSIGSLHRLPASFTQRPCCLLQWNFSLVSAITVGMKNM